MEYVSSLLLKNRILFVSRSLYEEYMVLSNHSSPYGEECVNNSNYLNYGNVPSSRRSKKRKMAPIWFWFCWDIKLELDTTTMIAPANDTHLNVSRIEPLTHWDRLITLVCSKNNSKTSSSVRCCWHFFFSVVYLFLILLVFVRFRKRALEKDCGFNI